MFSVIEDLIKRRDEAMERAVQASIDLRDPLGKSPQVEAIMKEVTAFDMRILRLKHPLVYRTANSSIEPK